MNVREMLLDWLFPSNIYCICCGNLIDKSRTYALCDQCLGTIHWANDRTCIKCGKILADTERRRLLDELGEGQHLCADCRHNTHYFDRGFTCMQYGSMEKEMIHRFKFNGCAYMGDKLGNILLDKILLENLSVDVVTAVPMHSKNQLKRGYNQSALMAKVVAKGLGVVYNDQVLIRKQYKAPMNKLDAEQRASNVKNSYGIHPKFGCFQNQSILLIDDIYTTGSTADECSRLLKEAGAENVYVLTLAAGAD
ncbi:ComF family protein [Aminipila luticellarii]|uniref:ComF family protein n=1 Tax=Aminipila luticellarii TaxID=2507160 RepID=A0A410PSS2_9FIRM|nr:ComF family protein [Aminipila luticellarii]QAT41950.1 ComF family protein [Aminipila luticellarii]